MTWLDIVILLPLLIGLVRGTMRGLITEVIAILAVILGFIGAKIWGQTFSTWLLTQFTWPQPVCDAVAYALLFLGIAIALNIVGRLLSKLLKAINLGWIKDFADIFHLPEHTTEIARLDGFGVNRVLHGVGDADELRCHRLHNAVVRAYQSLHGLLGVVADDHAAGHALSDFHRSRDAVLAEADARKFVFNYTPGYPGNLLLHVPS